ncbi:hypothetical protein [Actinomadura algeriensis]|uniref:MYXO-CTERM domain-containing protein n=1 Tax=Actinomadura algeriensis TaxID=1679523 RepID=A0ABR9JZ07_9ACTN|nr:hypothetical protein [Actinomadura algeriensis]MBE1535806.1 hypothetical protein [Actinomadura algeriensis]
MTESKTGPARPNRWSGLAGLLVALFVVAGLVAGYGLGHAPPTRICTEHAVSAPVAAAVAPGGPSAGDAVAAAPGSAAAPDDASGPRGGLLAGGHADAAAPMPIDLPGPAPGDVCLCLAVLLTLLALGFAGRARRPFLRLPVRTGRVPAPPGAGTLAAPSLSALQVLRL